MLPYMFQDSAKILDTGILFKVLESLREVKAGLFFDLLTAHHNLFFNNLYVLVFLLDMNFAVELGFFSLEIIL